MNTPQEILGHLAQRGITVYPRGDRLRVRHGSDELAPEHRELILVHKPALIEYLGDDRVQIRAAQQAALSTWSGPRLAVDPRWWGEVQAVPPWPPEWDAFADGSLALEAILTHDCGQRCYSDPILVAPDHVRPAERDQAMLVYRASEVELIHGRPPELLERIHGWKMHNPDARVVEVSEGLNIDGQMCWEAKFNDETMVAWVRPAPGGTAAHA